MIQSMLDNDLYKFTMQNAVLKYQQKIPVEYRFNDRNPGGKFNIKFFDALSRELDNMERLALTHDELDWLKHKYPILGDDYLSYLYNYRYNPDEITFVINEGKLELTVNGTWEHTILWEVPLMALISELYFMHCDTNWSFVYDDYAAKYREKIWLLNRCEWCDFGTRRRRSYNHQDLIVYQACSGCIGTSNTHFAHKYGVNAIGTMAHEWIMGISALESLRHANKHALRIWSDIYRGNFGIALADTFGTDAFLNDFDSYFARLYDGVRHDSGDPYQFGEKIIKHYEKFGIDPLSKVIVFSDGLKVSTAVSIEKYFNGKIKTSFGIGTNLTNDYDNPLNMVIKLHSCNNIPVVKLSDIITKQTGDPGALDIARRTFYDKSFLRDERMFFGKEDIKVVSNKIHVFA